MTVCFYATFTQDASVYKNIGVAGNFDWNVIINIADNVFIIWPISQYYLSPPSKTVGVTSVLL